MSTPCCSVMSDKILTCFHAYDKHYQLFSDLSQYRVSSPAYWNTTGGLLGSQTTNTHCCPQMFFWFSLPGFQTSDWIMNMCHYLCKWWPCSVAETKQLYGQHFSNSLPWKTIAGFYSNFMRFFSKAPINKKAALVPMMAWRRTGDNPLSEPMLV